MPEQIENGMLMPPEPRASDKWLRVCNECSHVYDLCGHDNCPECQRNREAAEEIRGAEARQGRLTWTTYKKQA